MTVRWVVVAFGFLILLPIAVFLRPAISAPIPEKTRIIITTVCKLPVAFFIVHKGRSYFATIAQIESDEEIAKTIAPMFAGADVYTSETAAAAGIGCPKNVSL